MMNGIDRSIAEKYRIARDEKEFVSSLTIEEKRFLLFESWKMENAFAIRNRDKEL